MLIAFECSSSRCIVISDSNLFIPIYLGAVFPSLVPWVSNSLELVTLAQVLGGSPADICLSSRLGIGLCKCYSNTVTQFDEDGSPASDGTD